MITSGENGEDILTNLGSFLSSYSLFVESSKITSAVLGPWVAIASFFIESENYRIANCIAEITFGCLFGLFSILAFFEFFPLDTLIFFLIPSVFILGWVFMKIDVTPEKLSLRSEEHTSELQSRPHLVCRL